MLISWSVLWWIQSFDPWTHCISKWDHETHASPSHDTINTPILAAGMFFGEVGNKTENTEIMGRKGANSYGTKLESEAWELIFGNTLTLGYRTGLNFKPVTSSQSSWNKAGAIRRIYRCKQKFAYPWLIQYICWPLQKESIVFYTFIFSDLFYIVMHTVQICKVMA